MKGALRTAIVAIVEISKSITCGVKSKSYGGAHGDSDALEGALAAGLALSNWRRVAVIGERARARAQASRNLAAYVGALGVASGWSCATKMHGVCASVDAVTAERCKLGRRDRSSARITSGRDG